VFKPTTLRVYLLRAIECGLDPNEILRGSGHSWNDINALKPLDLDTISGLFGIFARRVPADFGMKCGNACSIRDFGIVGFSMMSMPTLRQAFEYWTRYSLLAGHPLVSSITESDDQWTMSFVPRRIMSADALRFCLEVSIAALEPVIQELTELPANTRRIDFAFGRPEAADNRYTLFTTSHIQFGAKQSTYSGERSNLDRPIRSYDGDVSRLCYQQSDKCLAELTHSRTIREQIEDLLVISAGEMPTLEEMATALSMSSRTLQRELTEHKLSYQLVVKEFRQQHAEALLIENRFNIKTIAYVLGFKDVSSFRRAFRTWTGQSIGQWKQTYLKSNAKENPSKPISVDFYYNRRLPANNEERVNVSKSDAIVSN